MAQAMTAEEYFARSDAFVSDYRWANGASWGSGQRPKLSSYESYGCYAYGVDFARYMYNVERTYTEGSVYFSASEIRTGDVIRIDWGSSQHTVVVLERNGNTLRTAEGNINGRVRVSDAGYTISGNGVIASWNQYASFKHGYHFNTGGATTRVETYVPNPTWRNGRVTRVAQDTTFLLLPACAPAMGVSRCYASWEDGTRLNIWPTVAENESWQFSFVAQGDGTYAIEAGDTGKYLHVDLNTGVRYDGAPVVLWDGHGNDNSSWWVEDNGDGTYSFRNRGTDRYLDVTAASGEDGALIEQWEGNSTSAQKFRLVEVTDNGDAGSEYGDVVDVPEGVTYTISAECAPTKGVSRIYASHDNGTRLNTWPTVASHESWHFRFVSQDDGTYAIEAGDTGKYLHVFAGIRGNGTAVVLWDGHGNDNSSWWVEDNGDGTYSFRNRGTGGYLDVTGASGEDGALIEQWERNGSTAQRFRLEEVPEDGR